MEKEKCWKIDYCGFIAPKVLLNAEKPFQTAYIEASTPEKAAQKLRHDLRLTKMILTGKPKEVDSSGMA